MCASLSLAPSRAGNSAWGCCRPTSCPQQTQQQREKVAVDQYSCGCKLMGVSRVQSSDILLQQKDCRIVNSKALIELVNGLKRLPLHLRNSLLACLCCAVRKMASIMTASLQGSRCCFKKMETILMVCPFKLQNSRKVLGFGGSLI